MPVQVRLPIPNPSGGTYPVGTVLEDDDPMALRYPNQCIAIPRMFEIDAELHLVEKEPPPEPEIVEPEPEPEEPEEPDSEGDLYEI